MEISKFYAPPLSLFGYGCIAGLSDELKAREYKKILIVTDKVICDIGIADKVTSILKDSKIDYAIYNGVKPNPTIINVEDGLRMFKEENCDCIITIGGGSPHDCGKAISVLSANDGELKDFIGIDKAKNKGADMIMINTTAGTGSECTRSYVITDEATHSKYGIRDKYAQATIAVNDWELMMSLPEAVTAGTGMDALTHAVECLVSTNTFLLTTELALSAIKLVFNHLEDAVNTPSNVEAREGMATAQYLAGLAFGNAGVALAHAMSHQLSAVYDLPHGLSNAILLPEVMRFNKEACAPQLAQMGRLLDPVKAINLSDNEIADIAINKISDLSKAVGTTIPLARLGVKKEDFELLAEKTLQDASLKNNPIIPKKEEVISIFELLY